MKQASRPSLGLAAAALGLLMLIATGCSRPEPAPEPVRAVKTVTVSAQSAGGRHEFAAEVRARVESRLGFRVGGKMVARSAEVGQRVRAGDVLAQLDASDLRLAQDAATAAMRTAQVQAELAEAEFKRYQELRAQNFISAFELERRQTALESSRAQLEQARAQAQVQRNQAGYSALVATAPGIVTAVDAEVGAVLAAGTPVLRLAHDGPRDAVFAVSEDAVGALRALLGRPGAIEVRSWGTGAKMTATVREVAAAADPATRTFLVKADLGRDAPVQLGQTVTAALEQPARSGVVKLPLSAVTQQKGRTSVWVVDRATMTVNAQPVEVAGAEGNAVLVGAGLTPGQIVVVAGVHVLAPGQKVAFFAAPSTAAPTAGAAVAAGGMTAAAAATRAAPAAPAAVAKP